MYVKKAGKSIISARCINDHEFTITNLQRNTSVLIFGQRATTIAIRYCLKGQCNFRLLD